MKLTLEMDMDNSAFEHLYAEETELCFQRVLKRIAAGISADHIHDSNGNKIGKWEIHFDD